MPTILIGVGSILGNRESILREAVSSLGEVFDLISVSEWFTYPAVGGPDGQQDFLNGAVLAKTSRPADEVRQILHRVEKQAGRERIVRWSSRTLDCDLLLYGSEKIWTPDLKVPHPRMVTRRFVLEPANEIACDIVHPESGWTIGELFQHLKSTAPYFCITGSERSRAAELANQVAAEAYCTLIPQLPLPTFANAHDGAGDDATTALEWSRLLQQQVTDESRSANDANRPIVGSNWDYEPWLVNPELPRAIEPRPGTIHPKLLIVLDDKLSEYGQRICNIDEGVRIPTLFLSQNAQEALQDAVGAVLAMRM